MELLPGSRYFTRATFSVVNKNTPLYPDAVCCDGAFWCLAMCSSFCVGASVKESAETAADVLPGKWLLAIDSHSDLSLFAVPQTRCDQTPNVLYCVT
jgi:hypothetical protein